MGQRKKIKGEPSQSFKNKIISLSFASTWEECRKEWKFAFYYYLLDIYKCCVCSPRGIKHAVILVNEKTQAEILLCGSCAEDYFDIYDGGIIENSVRRLMKNSRLGMNLECLNYLDRYNILNVREIENYDVGLKCRSEEWIMEYKEGINHKLIVFANYRYRDIFNKIDCLLVKFEKIGDVENIKSLAYARQCLLHIKATELERLEEIEKINNLIDYHNIDINNYTINSYKEKELARKSIERYIRSSLNDWLHESDYFQKKIKSGQAIILPHCVEYEPGFDKESYLAGRKIVAPKTIEIEGLEDEIKIVYGHCEDEDLEIIKAEAIEIEGLEDGIEMAGGDYEDEDLEIIKAEAIKDLDFDVYAKRVYENEDVGKYRHWSFVKFTSCNNSEWYGKFCGAWCHVAISTVHNIILVLAGYTLYQLDRKTGNLMDLESHCNYKNLTVTPKGDFIIASFTKIEKITNTIKEKTEIKSSMDMWEIDFCHWKENELIFVCSVHQDFSIDYIQLIMIYNSKTNRIKRKKILRDTDNITFDL